MKNCKNANVFLAVISFFALFGCKKEYERPDVFKEDIYAGKKKEQLERTFMDPEVAFDKSTAVLLTNQVKLMDSSSKISETPLYIYKISGGKILKGNDSIALPFIFFSNYDLNVSKNRDSAKVYLEPLQDYQIFAKELNAHFQTVKNAPTFTDK